MTPREIGILIIERWRGDHSPIAIMMQLICLGVPTSKDDVLSVIRAYIDHSSENLALGRSKAQ